MNCLQCKSDDIVQGVNVIDRFHYEEAKKLRVRLHGEGDVPVMAHVCAACGFVMLAVLPEGAAELKRIQEKKG